TEQASAIVDNTAKVGITTEQASAIVDNTAKVGYTQPIYEVNTFYEELGGYVIQISTNGKHGLVVAKQDQGSSTWYLANDLLSDPSKHDIHGKKFLDWRLPTKRELDLMYDVYSDGNAVDLTSGNYWSSTEHGYNTAWKQNFANGYQFSHFKYNADLVRAVRAF
uniref:Lcl C-terminal domain-containing protein n=1 Tax=uncultured Polaribacter sp. TaxID=174711 RepID=UPI00260EF2B7